MPRSFRRIAARLFECDNKIRAYTRAVIILSTCRSLASLSRASFLSLFSSLPLLLIALCAMSPLKRNGSRESRRNRKERKKKRKKEERRNFYRFVFIVLFARAPMSNQSEVSSLELSRAVYLYSRQTRRQRDACSALKREERILLNLYIYIYIYIYILREKSTVATSDNTF